MDIIDRLVSKISPTMGVKRILAKKQLDILNSGYGNHGANTVKKSMIGWNYYGGSPDEDIHDNIEILRERSRDLYMGGATIATGALKTMRTNVIGAGLRLKPQLDTDVLGISQEEAVKLESKIEKEFLLWSESKNCDAQRMNDFYELQQLVFMSWIVSGECLALLPYIENRGDYGICVQIIESDFLKTPMDKSYNKKIKYGIEVGDYGEPIAYYFYEKHPLSNDLGFWGKYKKIKAYGDKTGLPNVLHIMESERPGQLRGVPVLAPVIEDIKQLGRYQEAELMAAVVSGLFTTFITTNNENNSEFSFGESIPVSEEIDSRDEYSVEMGPGAVISLAPGEKPETANPGRPNTAFDGFVNSISRQIGAALEIPHELLLKKFDSSYSASRAALLEAWKMFRMRRTWMANDFCNPVYEQWFYEAVSKGRIEAPGFFTDPLIRKAYLSCEWSGPTQGQIDPLKEVVAATKRVEQGFSTRTRETIELTGGDFVKNTRILRQENQLLNESSSIKLNDNRNLEKGGIEDGEKNKS